MRLNDVGNCLFEISSLFLFLGLELLELSCILKHLLRVGVSVLFQLNLLVLEQGLDSFFEDLLQVPLVLVEGVVSVSVLQLRAGEFLLKFVDLFILPLELHDLVEAL